MKTIPSLPVYWLPNYHVFWYNKTIKNNPLASGDNLPRWKNPRVMHPASPKCTLFSEMHPTPGKCTLLFWKCTLKSQKCTRVLFLGAFFYQNMSTKPKSPVNKRVFWTFLFCSFAQKSAQNYGKNSLFFGKNKAIFGILAYSNRKNQFFPPSSEISLHLLPKFTDSGSAIPLTIAFAEDSFEV